MRIAAYMIVIALSVVPAALRAQTPAVRGSNPAERLLNHRADLSLTTDQVRRLETIDRSTVEQDAQLRAQLEALRGQSLGEPLRMREMSLEQRQKLAANRAEMQQLMSQMRAIHWRASADARAVLTQEQNARADQFLFAGPGRGAGRGPAAGAPWQRQHRAAGRRGW